MIRRLVLSLLVSALFVAEARADELPITRRVAIVVGSNAAPPGRRPLRFAHADARSVAVVLRGVGGFSVDDVEVLLDPAPDAVLAAIDRRMRELAAERGESMLVFHYAGHADAQSLFPGGRSLSYAALRQHLAGPGATVRIGIVDACRGGGWTGTRGLSETAPFDVEIPLDLATEGTVLIASSSGVEDAHESSDISAGFFTHHWNAALRGAADRNGDGVVSVSEAFDYAKRLTIRDSAATGADPQHPSFQMNVRGRTDVPLTRIAGADTLVVLEQETGPTEVVRLDSGLLVAEIPAGRGTTRFTLPPGPYLLRIRDGRATRAVEIALRPRQTLTVREAQMAAREATRVSRGIERRPVDAPSTPQGMWDLRFAFGFSYRDRLEADPDGVGAEVETSRYSSAVMQISHGLGRRGFWTFPLIFGARLGREGGTAVVPWLGLRSFGFGSTNGRPHLSGAPSLGLRLEAPIGAQAAFLLELSVTDSMHSWYRLSTNERDLRQILAFEAEAGFRVTFDDRVDVGAGVGVRQGSLIESGAVDPGHVTLSFGSLYRSGRYVPLVRVHTSSVFAFDVYGQFTYDFDTRRLGQTFLLGMSAVWDGARTRRARREAEADVEPPMEPLAPAE